MRAIKKGKYGTVQYVSENYVVRNKDLISKHVFAGNTRLVSNMVMQEEKSGKMVSTEQGCYYYHADHLGSSSVVTDKDGKFYEQLEYFPYGETWVHNKATAEQESTPYKFTSKELDPETGLYYFGARYYDGKLSRWTAADPAMVSYLPIGNNKDSKLPGHGGVYSTDNLDLYNYGGHNPIKFIDPNGCWKDETQTVVYDKSGVIRQVDFNKGEVTKGDTVNGLAERQLKTERGTNKFSESAVREKADLIRKNNNLKSDNLQIGQKLYLGLSKDTIIGEKGVESLNAESLVAALAIIKLGGITATTVKVGGPMLGNTAIEMGGNAQALSSTGLSYILTNVDKINTGLEIYSGTWPGPTNNHNQNKGFIINEIINYIQNK